jgi:amyloid beta precursor protein binding protein 1
MQDATAMTNGEGEGDGEPVAAKITPQHAAELVRYAGNELHSTSSVIGGMAAQEIVKLITHQYTPLQSTYIFNGIAACGSVLPL